MLGSISKTFQLSKILYKIIYSAYGTDSSNPDLATSKTLTTSGGYNRLDLSKSFAQLSLPSLLSLEKRATFGDASGSSGQTAALSLAVVARVAVKAYTQFGPLQGEPILERDVPEDFDMKDLWQVRDGLRT